jgi:hypothetical protein
MGRIKYQPEDRAGIKKAIETLRKHHGTHKLVALSLGLPETTYRDWRKRGVPGLFEERVLIKRAARIEGA